jgi:hypothetical protein
MRLHWIASAVGLATLLASSSATAQPLDEENREYCHHHWVGFGHCWRRPWEGPQLFFGADLGFGGMVEGGPFGFGSGTGSVTTFGPSWGLRFGVDFLPWLGVEARYVGMYNAGRSSVSQQGNVGYLTDGGEAVVRLILPLRYVHPYVFGGVGVYDNALAASAAARAFSTLTSNTGAGIPMGFGVDVPLSWHLSIGAEATYHFLLNESFSPNTAAGIDGADLTTFNAVLRMRL